MRFFLMRAIFFLFFFTTSFIMGCTDPDAIKVPPVAKFNQTLAVHEQWSARVGQGAARSYLKLSPAIFDNLIFALANNGVVEAIDKNSGKVIWSKSVGEPLTSGIAASDSKIFFGSSNGLVLALNQIDGKRLWWAETPSEILATPVVGEGRVFVKTEDGKIYAFDDKNGKQIWMYSMAEPNLVLRSGNSPALVNGLLISGFASGEIVALKASSGEVVWQNSVALPEGTFTLQRMVDIDASPLVSGNIVYVASYQGAFSAIKISNGDILWKKNFPSYAGFSVDERNIYLVVANGEVVALNKINGELVWKNRALTYHELTTPILTKSGLVTADSLGNIYWLDQKDGHLLATVMADKSGIVAPAIASGNNIYVMTKKGDLYCYTVN